MCSSLLCYEKKNKFFTTHFQFLHHAHSVCARKLLQLFSVNHEHDVVAGTTLPSLVALRDFLIDVLSRLCVVYRLYFPSSQVVVKRGFGAVNSFVISD